jgi:ferredoxin
MSLFTPEKRVAQWLTRQGFAILEAYVRAHIKFNARCRGGPLTLGEASL